MSSAISFLFDCWGGESALLLEFSIDLITETLPGPGVCDEVYREAGPGTGVTGSE